MKQKKRSKVMTDAKPPKGRLSSLFSRNRSGGAGNKRSDEKNSDWHPCSGPFPTD